MNAPLSHPPKADLKPDAGTTPVMAQYLSVKATHPDAMLFDMIKHGLVPGRTAPPGYESDMPAYSAILSDEDIVAVIAYIKSSWPPKVLEAQKEVTQQQAE